MEKRYEEGSKSREGRNGSGLEEKAGLMAIPVTEAVGMVLAHDISEIREDFKGRAFRKGHIVKQEDICHLQRLGKENLFVLEVSDDELHENDAARELAAALSGNGVAAGGAPREGRINIVAERDGLLKIDREALLAFNMLGEVMCATLHGNTPVSKGRIVAGTRAIPLVIKKEIVEEAVRISRRAGGIISVKEIRKPRAGVVITGNEIYYGRIKDAFAPVIRKKIEDTGGEIVGICFVPDDQETIRSRLSEFMATGVDLLIITGGMSVDPDDVTRFAVQGLGATEFAYGSAMLPGAMFLVARLRNGDGKEATVLGIPACGMYSRITIFDIVLPRILAGERIGRRELAELGHGGLCLKCGECRYPVCPFGKS